MKIRYMLEWIGLCVITGMLQNIVDQVFEVKFQEGVSEFAIIVHDLSNLAIGIVFLIWFQKNFKSFRVPPPSTD